VIVFGSAEWQFYYNLFCQPVFFHQHTCKNTLSPKEISKRHGFANLFWWTLIFTGNPNVATRIPLNYSVLQGHFIPFVVGHEQVHLNRPRQWKKQS